jgi:hypothetical protein
MKKVGLAILVGAMVATGAIVVGCNNGSCSFASKCPNDGPNDPVQEQNNSTLCNNRKNDPNCGGFYNDYIACFQSNQTCTSTGVTDYTITDGICGAQYATWVNCYYGTDGGGFADAAGE